MKTFIKTILLLLLFTNMANAQSVIDNNTLSQNAFSIKTKEFMATADLNNPETLNKIGDHYYYADGIASNNTLALMWYIIAAKKGSSVADERKQTVERILPPSQVGRAYQLAKIYLKKNQINL